MIGFGFDVHKLMEGESLIIGGVEIPALRGTVAHSDGDVLLHAICDALLGALALGDIGEHFPDTDPAYAGISSMELLREVRRKVSAAGYRPVNIDATLSLERPKILPYKEEMRNNIAEAAGLPAERVSIKATTNEGLGFVGAGLGVQAYAVTLLEKEA